MDGCEKEINNHLQAFFSSLFQSSGQRNFDEVLHKMDRSISDVMNNNLIRGVWTRR